MASIMSNSTSTPGWTPQLPTGFDDVSYLGTLRLVFPVVLLGALIIRFATIAFLAMMNKIQAQGWVHQEENDPVPAKIGTSAEDEDAPKPVVVKVRTVRRGMIMALFAGVAMTYFVDGAVQIVSILITKVFLPETKLFQNIIYYVVGGLLIFSATPIAMTFEERVNHKDASWGTIYPRLITAGGLLFEVAIGILTAKIIHNAMASSSSSQVLSTHLGILCLRLLLLLLLLLLQTPLLAASTYVPFEKVGDISERTALLGASTNGYGSENTPIHKKGNALQSSRPPPKRPPDPKSLRITTLFSRVKVLFPYLWPYKSLALQVLALICVALMLLKRFTKVLVPVFFGRVVGDLSAGRTPYVNIGLYVLSSFLQDTNTMLYRYLWLPVEQYSEREMTRLSFDCLLNLSLAYHTQRKTGELLRILNRGDAINNFFQTLIFTFIPILIDLPVAVIVLSVKYGALIVFIVMCVSLIFVSTSIVLAESRVMLYRKLRDESQFMSQIRTDTLFNFETVKIFTAEKFESERLYNALRVYQKGYFKVYSAWNSLSLIQDSISAFGLLVCSFILAHRVINGTMDIGNYVTFVSYLSQLYGPLNQIAGLYRTVMSNLVDTEQLIELLQEDKDVVDRPGAVDLQVQQALQPDKSRDLIVFDNVRFSYDNKQDQIKGISFSIKAGHSVALVGPSGAGKSTVMRLLYRFYDVSSGSIKIDGHDIRDITQTSLRKQIGIVPQDPVLFNETARYNIAYGGGVDTQEEEIFEAARAASLHDRIMSFPDQYETRVGERGQRLSGGEKQRVAIARVVLKNPPILLLDEATSSLDTANERAIQQRLRELSKGRTTLAIAHRLSTIVDCDVIHCLHEGVIAESGSHHDLLAKGGIYAELWAKQIEGQEASRVGTPIPGATSGAETPVLGTD